MLDGGMCDWIMCGHSIFSCRPLLASSREEIGPTAVWLDGTTPGVDGGEGCGVRVVGEVEEGVWSSGGPGLVLRGEELGANQVKLVPVTNKGSGTVEVR